MDARTRTDIHNVIGGKHRFLVVLHHQHRIPQIAQTLERREQLVVVALVQADARLVEDIQHARQRGADLRRQPDALTFAAGQRPGGSGERQVFQPDAVQEAEPFADLLEDSGGDHLIALGKLQLIDECERVRHRHIAEFADVDPAYRHSETHGGEAASFAGVAGDLAHVRFDLLLDPAALRITETAFQVVDNPLKFGFVMALPVGCAAVELDFLALRSVEQDIYDLVGQVGDGGVEREFVVLRQAVEVHRSDGIALHSPAAALETALIDGQPAVREDLLRIDLHEYAEPGAFGTRAVGVVEREHTRGELLDADAVLGAGVILRERDVLAVHNADHYQTAGKRRRRLDGIGQPRPDLRLDHQPVHHNLDGMLFILLRTDRLGEVVDDAVHADARKSAAAGGVELLDVLALARPYHRSQKLDPRALRQGKHLIDDLIDRLLADLLAAHRAVRDPDARIEQSQVIVDFRHRADGGARVLGRRFLIDRDGGGKALDVIHVRLFHLAEELPRVGGERFHIAPLALRVDGVERKGGLPGAGQPRQHDKAVARDFDVDILEIVLPRAFYENIFWSHCFYFPSDSSLILSRR